MELSQLRPEDLLVERLGKATRPSPVGRDKADGWTDLRFRPDGERVRLSITVGKERTGPELSFERAGAREQVYFPPEGTRVAIVTCGGLCPGINAVIRGLVLNLRYLYGVTEVLGVRYGYRGLAPDTDVPPVPLSPHIVEDIHIKGGTILGSSRGMPKIPRLVDSLVDREIDVLFTVGGDGTLRGANAIHQEVKRRELPIAVVGVPKTIDNDIPLVYRSFGFRTAVDEACKVLAGAETEAKGVMNGVGLVKLMGRHAGFIAAHATLASGDVNYCLVPEVPVVLEGPGGFLAHLRERLRRRRHALVAVAEGCGDQLVGESEQRDASGNQLLQDVGPYLKERIGAAFREWGEEVNVKYFDPSYSIRSVPPNPQDNLFCNDLARHAVHAAMAGKTGLLIGYWHGVFTHVPLAAIEHQRKFLSPHSSLWHSVLSSTIQPPKWG